MGLDMYLNAKRYLWAHNPESDDARISKEFAALAGVPDMRVKDLIVEAAYWRKANQIHNWFVQKVQEGNDDCGNYEVSREQLTQLLELAREVKQSPAVASGALPTKSGFFFGSTDYGEYYMEDIDSTIEQLTKALELPEEWYFEYHSSW